MKHISFFFALLVTAGAVTFSLAAGGCVSGGDANHARLSPVSSGSGGDPPRTGQSPGLPGDGGGGVDGGGTQEPSEPAHPTEIQSLLDYTQTGVAPWEPVTQVHNVVVSSQVYEVHELAHYDPFTHFYQLPNGDLVMSNEPLEELVLLSPQAESEPLPDTEMWTGPDGEVEVFSNQIMVQFDEAVDQQDMEQLIAANNLEVIFSDFEPAPEPEPEAENLNAYFRFEYQTEDFANFQAAYNFFLNVPHAIEVYANDVTSCTLDYAQGAPGDQYFTSNETRHIQALELHSSPAVRMGPPYGGAFSTVMVAVIDSGVLRNHPDFTIPGDPNNNRKISWAGVTCTNKSYTFGTGWGVPTARQPGENRLHRHGSQVAGTVTATTSDLAHGGSNTGVPSCAPACGVLPIALVITSDGRPTTGSVGEALVFLKEAFKRGSWTEDIRVVNMSLATPSNVGFWDKMIRRDLKDSDRLYLGSAGNVTGGELQGGEIVYPAGFQDVLGVSGAWIYHHPLFGTTAWYARDSANTGSNSRSDNYQTYPVSAIYGTVNDERERQDWSRSTSTPIYGGGQETYYEVFRGTSFACPQVAALAALLYDAHPERNRLQVSNRIINTKNTYVEQSQEFLGFYLAGPVDFRRALGVGW